MYSNQFIVRSDALDLSLLPVVAFLQNMFGPFFKICFSATGYTNFTDLSLSKRKIRNIAPSL